MRSVKFKLVSVFYKLSSTLKQELGKDMSRKVVGKTEYHYKALDKLKPKEKGVMRIHRTLWILGLALYRALQDELDDRDDLIDIVRKVLWRSTLCDFVRLQAFFVRRSKYPFNLFLRLLGPRNERFFTCPPWKKVEVELENGVGWDQLECPVYEFFKEENELELMTRAYCDLDRLIADLVPNVVELRRERTLAKGDSSCDFYYYRKINISSGIEHMPNLAFRLMSFILSIRDFLYPVWKKLDQFDIENGFFIVDFGCGPGSFVEYASKLVGNRGKVYAVDIHPLAIKAIKEKARRKGLENVVPVLATGYPVDIDSHSADVIYALDMFHHIQDAEGFLKELHRLLKSNGTLFIESGHQRMDKAKQKIMKSGCWVIIKEERNMFKCSPKEHRNV